MPDRLLPRLLGSRGARRAVAAAAAVVLLACTTTARAHFSGLVLFGDSLTDVGNVHDQTFGISPPSPPHYDGRFSNGPLWAEHLAAGLGLPPLLHSRDGGRDYAFGGTKTGSGSTFYFPFSFPNLGSQINNYLGAHDPAAGELFVIWGGGNDFIDGQTNPSVPVNNIRNHVTALANAGARQFLVPNLPPLGQVPRFRGTTDQATMDARSGQFNDLLVPALDALESSLGVQIFQLDVEGLFRDLLADPAAYGFSNVTSPALVGNTPVPNPDAYLFWDEIHPTRVAHGMLGTLAGELVVTHTWVSAQTGGNWFDPAGWDPQGVPAEDWIAHVVNANTALPQAVAVGADSAVQHLLVRGDEGRMTLIVQSAAKLSAAGGVEVAGDGRLELHGGTLSSATVLISSGGSLAGTGNIDGNVTNAGLVEPGQPSTVLRINGDYAQTSAATLAIELGGENAGEYDRLLISGGAALDGVLALRLVDNFVAMPGQSFDVLSFASRQGELTVVNETGYAGLSFQKMWSPTSLSLSAAALGGDANLDGVVNLSDFNILAGNFGLSERTWLGADFTGDGVVNLSDFNVLAGNFGLSASGSHVTPSDWAAMAAVVPEPVGGLLALAGLATRCGRPRRRRTLLREVPAR